MYRIFSKKSTALLPYYLFAFSIKLCIPGNRILILMPLASKIRKLIFLSLITVYCSHSKKFQATETLGEPKAVKGYEVYKIDSVNSYYLVYAKRNDTLFKIIFRKAYSNTCIDLSVGKIYDLQLYSIWRQPIMVGGENMSPSANPHVNCLGFDDSTRICLERDSINDLSMAENLQGLCLLRK